MAELLHEYRSASRQPALMEVAIDHGGSIAITLSDDSPQQHLQLDVSITEALARLMAAKHTTEAAAGGAGADAAAASGADCAGVATVVAASTAAGKKGRGLLSIFRNSSGGQLDAQAANGSAAGGCRDNPPYHLAELPQG